MTFSVECSDFVVEVVLLLYILATPKVIQGWKPTCDSTHSSWLHSAAPLGDHTTSIMAGIPSQSHSPYTVLTSHCSINSINSERQAKVATNMNLLIHWHDWAGIWIGELLYRSSVLYRFGHRDQSWCQTSPMTCRAGYQMNQYLKWCNNSVV